jgi:hypothetical protein
MFEFSSNCGNWWSIKALQNFFAKFKLWPSFRHIAGEWTYL